MTKLTIHEWDESDFTSSREAWTELLTKANCDQLFLSWEWLHSWWSIFGKRKHNQLKIITVLDENANLIGIAPLFLTKTVTKKIIVSRKLQFIGNYWRGIETMPTELLEFITSPSNKTLIIRAIFEYISNLSSWDELILSGLPTESETFNCLKQHELFQHNYVRKIETITSYSIPLDKNFEQYTEDLGRNTRLKLFNRRNRIKRLGEFKFNTNITQDPRNSFYILNELHKKRWGKYVFEDQRLEFNLEITSLFSSKNRAYFSTLSLDNKVFSIQYNININSHIYNIQAGFEEKLYKKVAPGYLHFGYEIEEAYNKKHKCYDLLAGEGKNINYKQHLTSTTIQTGTIQLIRKPLLLKLLYKLYDKLNDI